MNTEILNSSNESRRLRELIAEIGLPLRRLPEIISLNHEDCLNWWSYKKPVAISDTHFKRLTNILDINEDQLFHGTYDKALARRRLFGTNEPLPERYNKNQNSYLRTSVHIMRYILLTRGQLFADQVLRSLNISPLVYQNADAAINLTYFSDLLEVLEKKGFSQKELDALGSIIFLSLKETKLGRKFSTCKNYFDIYKILAENFSYFDTNFEYHSEFIGHKYILKTILPLDHHLPLKDANGSLARLMRYRHILLAWFPYMAGLTPLFPKTEMIRRPSKLEVRYEIDLGPGVTRLLNLL